MWLSILKKFWKEAIALVVIIPLIIMIYFKNNTIDNQEIKIKELTSNILSLETQLLTCSEKIIKQSDDIQKAADAALVKLADIEKFKVVIAELDKSHKSEINKLRNQKVPKTCDETKQYLRDNLENLKW